MFKISSIVGFCVAFVLLAGCSGAANGATRMPQAKRILFIGNSFTFINGGIDNHLKRMAPQTVTAVIAEAGYTLQRHWQDGKALAEIRKGGWAFVVLQEQSQRPVLERDAFLEYAGKFDAEVRKSGGKTVLLMT